MRQLVTMNYRGQQVTVDTKQAAILQARLNRTQPGTVEDVVKTHAKEAVGDTLITLKSTARTAILGAAYTGVITTAKVCELATKATTTTNNWSVRIAEQILGRSK